MFPRVVGANASRQEKQVFDLFQRALPESYVVLHSVKWLQRSTKRGEDGEADFVVVNQDNGVLILEVKGGDVRYDAREGKWSTTAAGTGDRTTIRDPYDQAVRSKKSLLRFLESTPGWSKSWGPFGHAVCLPNGVFSGSPLSHTHPQITLDSRSTASDEKFRDAVMAAFGFWVDGSRLGPAGLDAIVNALAHDIEIRQPLGMAADESDREILRLSDQQLRVLQLLSGARRVAVSGPAGAGKTLLAAEKAKRLARSGSRTLLTCFNRPLGDYLKASIEEPGLDVASFHHFCLNMANEAGWRIRVDPWWRDEQWAKVPEYLVKAVDKLGPRYDAIVVDEAQDFSAEWWLPLEMTMFEPGKGVLYVFYDSNQAIYRRDRPPLPDGLIDVPLNESWRNTRQIFAEVMRLYEGPDVTCHGPEGVAVERLKVAPSNMRREIGKILDRLLRRDRFAPRDIVVLTPHGLKNNPIVGTCGVYQLTPTPSATNEFYVSTVHRFKGLDAKVVIVVQVPPLPNPDQRSLLYVAYSRARSLLVVLEETRG